MKKTSTFESLNDAKFRTLESKELESVTGGMMPSIMSLDTITVTPSGSSNDGQDVDKPYDEM